MPDVFIIRDPAVIPDNLVDHVLHVAQNAVHCVLNTGGLELGHVKVSETKLGRSHTYLDALHVTLEIERTSPHANPDDPDAKKTLGALIGKKLKEQLRGSRILGSNSSVCVSVCYADCDIVRI